MPARAAMGGRVQYWMKGEPIQNFGDFLTEVLLERVFRGDAIEARCIHIIGSVVSDHYATVDADANAADAGRVVFWGCGLRNDRSLSKKLRANVEFLAVRGPLIERPLIYRTRFRSVIQMLLPALYQPKIAQKSLGKTVCVPHFSDTRCDDDLLVLSGCEALLRPDI